MEQQVYQMYLEELENIAPLEEEEQSRLASALAAGDKSVSARLIEGSLRRVLDIAAELAASFQEQSKDSFEKMGISLEELVLEGNMALTLSVNAYSDGDFDSYIAGNIRKAMETIIQEQQAQEQVEEELLARVNVLQKVSQLMAEELGREANVEELAAKMKMTAEEIKDIMKLTLDAMSVDGE